MKDLVKAKDLLNTLISNLKPWERPCPFILYCEHAFKCPPNQLPNVCCYGGTGSRELFREHCIHKASRQFWKEERKMKETVVVKGEAEK